MAGTLCMTFCRRGVKCEALPFIFSVTEVAADNHWCRRCFSFHFYTQLLADKILAADRNHARGVHSLPSTQGGVQGGVRYIHNHNLTGLITGHIGYERVLSFSFKRAPYHFSIRSATSSCNFQVKLSNFCTTRRCSAFFGLLNFARKRSWSLRYDVLLIGTSKVKCELLQDFRHLMKATGEAVATLRIDVRGPGHMPWQNRLRAYSGNLPYPTIRKLLSAASLACVRSQVVSRMIAVIVGEATVAHLSAVDVELFQIPLETDRPYHPAHIVSLLLSLLELVILVLRAAYLAALFTPAVVLAPFADSCGAKFRERWLSLVHFSLEHAGAAFIKWGQWAAARPDLFPKDLCAQLTRLHTRAPAHKYSESKRTIEAAFGRRLDEIFEDFEEEPVASGSIAQVHRAVLRFRYPGQKSKPMVVAVKVRHPGVSNVIRRDFTIINWCAKISHFVPGLAWLRLDESIQQFAVFMLTQVDLAREAAHLSRFIYNFRGWKDVSFPKPLYPLVHPAVLVETYEQGESVSRFVDRPGKNRLNTALATLGTHTLLKMLLVDNFIHADLHPGNILVRMEPGNPAPNKQMFKTRPHVVLLDVGMIAELNPEDRSTLLEFFKAVALKDGKLAAECTLKFSRDQGCPNPRAFIEDVDNIFQFWNTEEGDALHAGDCMQELLEQVRRHKVNIDGDVCTVMVTTLVLEGWQRKLDPEFNIMDTLRQLLFRADWAKSLSYTIDGLMAP